MCDKSRSKNLLMLGFLIINVQVINGDKDLPQLQRDIDDKRVEILCGYQ